MEGGEAVGVGVGTAGVVIAQGIFNLDERYLKRMDKLRSLDLLSSIIVGSNDRAAQVLDPMSRQSRSKMATIRRQFNNLADGGD